MNIRFIGVPSNVGALNKGTELGPRYLRNAGIVERLEMMHKITDLGDIHVENNLFRHDIGAVRNWPAPRMLWNKIIDSELELFRKDDFTIIIGGGCSIFTGVFVNFFNVYGDNAEILSIDHHIDIKVPDAEKCIGSTAFTLWFLTHENQWLKKPKGFNNTKITSIGFDDNNIDSSFPIKGIRLFDKEEIHSKGPVRVAHEYLSKLDKKARIIIHLDLDVIIEKDLGSVYMPSPDGLPLEMITLLLTEICKDERITGITVTEFSPNDIEGNDDSQKIVEMLCSILNVNR